MLMKDDRKKMAALVLDRIGKAPTQAEPTESPVDDSIPLESAAEDLIAAIENKDAKALVQAFKDFMELCETEEPAAPEAEQPY